jgi:hypothetical protein
MVLLAWPLFVRKGEARATTTWSFELPPVRIDVSGLQFRYGRG